MWIAKIPLSNFKAKKLIFVQTHTHNTYTQNKPLFPHIPCVLSPMSVSVICFIYMLYDFHFLCIKRKKNIFCSIFNSFFIILLVEKKKCNGSNMIICCYDIFLMKTSYVIKRYVTVVIEFFPTEKKKLQKRQKFRAREQNFVSFANLKYMKHISHFLFFFLPP